MIKTLIPSAIHVQVASFREAVSLANAHGFGGLDFNIKELADAIDTTGMSEVRSVFEQAGVKPAVFGLPVEWRQDEEKFQIDLAGLPRLAKAASDLGCYRTATWVLSGSNDRPTEENRAFHIARFGPVARIFADYGIALGLEFIGPKTIRDSLKYPFEYTCLGMLDLAKEIGPNVGLLFDVWHQYTSGGSVSEISKLTADNVVYVHLNDAPSGVEIDKQVDNRRELPGATGVIPAKEMLTALEGIGYTGPAGVEPFNEALGKLPSNDAKLSAVMDSINKVWP